MEQVFSLKIRKDEHFLSCDPKLKSLITSDVIKEFISNAYESESQIDKERTERHKSTCESLKSSLTDSFDVLMSKISNSYNENVVRTYEFLLEDSDSVNQLDLSSEPEEKQ